MGNDTYQGGGTTFVEGDPRWGTDGYHKMGGVEEKRLRKAREKLEKLHRRGAHGATGPEFQKELKRANRELDEAEKALKKARQPPTVSATIEQDIADVRKHVTALASSARSAIKLYEEERKRLVSMLQRNGLDPANYAETKKSDW